MLEFNERGGVLGSVEMKFCDTLKEQVTAKATPYVITDVEGRRLRTPTGLDTLAV